MGRKISISCCAPLGRESKSELLVSRARVRAGGTSASPGERNTPRICGLRRGGIPLRQGFVCGRVDGPSSLTAGPAQKPRPAMRCTRERPKRAVELVPGPKQLCERADVIIAVTPGRAALPALRAVLRTCVQTTFTSMPAPLRSGHGAGGPHARSKAGFVDAGDHGDGAARGHQVLTV